MAIASETIEGISIDDQNVKTFQTQLACGACSEPHEITQCSTFIKLSNSGRWNLARKKGLCYGCLKSTHIRSTCKSTTKCAINHCNKFHHKLLHTDPISNGFHFIETITDPIVSLRTLPVIVYNNGK